MPPAAPAQPAPAPPAPTSAAEADIVLGRPQLSINEYYTISFRLRGAALEKYSAFPDLEGFKKSGKSSTTTTRIVNGKTSVELTITQRYAAYGEGDYVLKPFTMTINGLTVRSGGGAVRVVSQPAAAAPAPGPVQGLGLLDQLFGKPKPQEYVELQDQAFLALVPDKMSVFVGEGVHIGLYFYLTPADQGLLNFYDLTRQLPAILRQLRQRTVWEESFNEQEIEPETVTAGGKQYLRYRLYEAMLYPLNAQPLTFPAVPLQMIKYRVAKKPAEGLDNRLAGYKTYLSQPRTIEVKPLPPHPLRDQVPVGEFRLLETIDRTAFRTGEAFRYGFVVEGEGNLAALSAPTVATGPTLEVYGPEVEQNLTRQAGRVGGSKQFSYRLVARQPGPLPLDTLFALVVFNPATARYDTLHSGLHPRIGGAAQRLATFDSLPADPFYKEVLNTADNTLRPLNEYRQVRLYANIILAVLLAVAIFSRWRSR
ncbi:BatD family protein [Hymenobacter daecheongensis]|uniref:BatD family protein n=1 Tax=Hymenobacter daecheongensis TaxID=496053 RepID=UPI001356501D|nr:BatD family protein [Hymenobacter daecheongensis]